MAAGFPRRVVRARQVVVVSGWRRMTAGPRILGVVERMHSRPAGPPERFTVDDRWDYTVAELLGIAREHGVPLPGRAVHQELVRVLRQHGVPLPPKPLRRR